LCCEAAVEAFMSDVEGNFAPKANHQLVATGQAIQIACSLTGRPANPAQKVNVSGVHVAFCSQACKTKADKAKGRERINLLFHNDAFAQGFKVKDTLRC